MRHATFGELHVCRTWHVRLTRRPGEDPCVIHVRDIAGHKIRTLECPADGDLLHPVREAWLEQDVPQCGTCQPGQIDADIKNVRRCGTYFPVRQAIRSAGRPGGCRHRRAADPRSRTRRL